MQLADLSDQDLKRLLELFPAANLRQSWPDLKKGTKEEICFGIAAAKEYDRIGAFVSDHFSCCKQHVFVLGVKDGAVLPATIKGEAPTSASADSALYILPVAYEILLREPLEETTIDFLWPIKVEFGPNREYALLRVIVMEKGVSQYFGERPCFVSERSVEEKDVVAEVEPWAAGRIDLHKGIKELWNTGFMDAPSAKVKKALSMASEIMDEALGIREHNPELYEQIVDNTLLSVLFAVADQEKHGVSIFTAQPSIGYLAFPRYCVKGGTDFVISEILQRNK